MNMEDAFEKATRSMFQRDRTERWSARSMGSHRWSREARRSRARSSHHGFTHNVNRQQEEKVYQADHSSDWLRLEYRKKIACDRMKDASDKLKHLRLSSRTSQEELNCEVKLVHAQETLQVLCQHLYQSTVVPPDYSECTDYVTLRDMTFSIRIYPGVDPYWKEHFFCLFIQGTDVRASPLTHLMMNVVNFKEIFRFPISSDTFAIDVRVYSIREKRRTAFSKTKQLLKKVFSYQEVVPSNCIYHGCMKITQKHLQDGTGALFEHEELSRIGKVSLELSMIEASPAKA